MKIISFTLKNKYYPLIPIEDNYRILEGKQTIVSVADGVTRDPVGLKNLGLDSLLGKVRFALRYPRPSPAKKAADSFVNNFVEFLTSQRQIDQLSLIKDAFTYVNKDLLKLNQGMPEVDYLSNDYLACVASGGIITKDSLYWGYIGDCGISVFDKKGKLRFRTTNDKKEADKHIDFKGKDFNDPVWRAERRRKYRNDPALKINGNLASYGALTGEETALDFVKTGRIKLKKGDYVLFYSDGIEDVIYSKEFGDQLVALGLDQIRSYCKSYQRKTRNFREGTLVALST